jgi:peptidoglycan/xylan/chitin deacetylase (PgdA/CDA1 family)
LRTGGSRWGIWNSSDAGSGAARGEARAAAHRRAGARAAAGGRRPLLSSGVRPQPAADRSPAGPVRLADGLRARSRVVGLDLVAALADGGAAPPHDLAAITFDDGYADVYEHAVPVLRRLGLPATIYVATAFVGSGAPYPFEASLPPAAAGRPLDWDQLREMEATGLVTVGAHTHTHADLSVLPEAAVERELAVCNAAIAERLGRPPAHFAYPWGRTSPAARAVVVRTYRTAAVGGSRKNPYGRIDARALLRIPIQRSDGRTFFRLKLESYLLAEEWLRGGGDAPRPAPAGEGPPA